jgi:outer membrane protein assembly factor BamA
MLRSIMGMVILDAEDGYGVTYGARLAVPAVIGKRSRLSFPLTWGGTRKAGVELEKSFTQGALSRIEFGGAIQQRVNPAFEIPDRRNRVWARAEKAIGDFRVGGTGGWQRVKFDGAETDIRSVAVDAVVDTRLDANLPRNAVYALASVERMFFESGEPIVRTKIDARGYLGLFGQQVLVGRVLREDANRAQPLYLRSLLGGWSNLRGFEAGFTTGDTLVATSLEWRMPISSPLSFGKMGVSVFVDWGTAYEKGERFRDQTLHRGVGGGVWLSVTGLRFGLAVAKGKGARTRVSFSGGITF